MARDIEYVYHINDDLLSKVLASIYVHQNVKQMPPQELSILGFILFTSVNYWGTPVIEI